MCSCLKPTNYGQRQCIGRVRRLIIPLVLLIPTLNRRMRCGLVKLVLLDRIHSSSPRTVGGSDRLSCCRKVKAVFMLDLQEITRVTVIECLRGLVRFRKHEMSRGRPRRHVSLHRSPLLPIEEAGEGGEESDDDVEAAEVWPLVGRGVPHVRVQRRNGEVASGRAGSEAGSGGGVDLQSDVEPPSSPLSIPGPSSDVGSVEMPSSPVTVEQTLGGQESEGGEQGGQDSGGNDNEELPPAARRALHELADHNTPVHDDDEVRIGRTRARTRAANQQSASILLATLGPFAATEVVEALIAEQKASENEELPKELIQDVEPEPASFQEASRSEHASIWNKAMSAEFEGLLGAGTFELAAKTPTDCNVIDARWVYKWKADETGKIVKAKARLVAKGFKQKHGVDYLETFSPTANAASIRLIVALACKYDLELLHFDIELQSELDHEVFMKLPPGCGSMSGKVVRLGKSLYGLRQASRTFNKRLVQDLKTIGFEQCLTDPCVLRFMMGDEVIGMIVIHVDDILYAGLKRLAEYLLQELGNLLPTKNLGEVNFFLGCAFRRDREAGTIEISQESYIRSVLERFNICRTSSIPASPANNYRSVKDDVEAGDVPFREVVGSLMWIANQTRPDISNAVRAVARHSHEPKKSHWKAAQKILNYLLETAHLGLKFKRDASVDVGTLVYVDADFASKANDRRSVSGAVLLVAGMIVAWFSRTQKCITLSTSEAEYVGMGDGVKEALFVNGLLVFLRPSDKIGKIQVLEDNEGAIALAENPLSSGNSKHIDIRHHFLRSLTEDGVLAIKHVPSELQHADILTKALPRDLFQAHRDFVLGGEI